MLDKVITLPPVGATPLIVTVPVEVWPPSSVDGFSVIVTGQGGLIVSAAAVETEPNEAVMLGIEVTETG